jgi:NAD(P)-dependent dehydrogenase (short-subunit alcohol dehydrogenase family)
MQDLHLTLSSGFLTSIIQSISALYLGSKLYQCWRFRSFLKMKGIDKTAIITGGASGLGYETCKLFASNGWRVIALDINAEGLEELQKISPLIVGYVVDISSVQSIDELLENLSKDSNILKNGVDTLVNCAGLAVPGPCLGVSWDRMELQFRVNVIGAMYLTRKIIPHLLHKNSGASIVNISSMAGVVAWPWQGAYTPSKFAFGGFTDVLRREVLASGLKLRISSINPGGILTPLSKVIFSSLSLSFSVLTASPSRVFHSNSSNGWRVTPPTPSPLER